MPGASNSLECDNALSGMAWHFGPTDCSLISEPNLPWNSSSIRLRVRQRLSCLHLRERAYSAEQIVEQPEGHYCGQKNCYLGQAAIIAQIRAVKCRVLRDTVPHGLHLDPTPFVSVGLALHWAVS